MRSAGAHFGHAETPLSPLCVPRNQPAARSRLVGAGGGGRLPGGCQTAHRGVAKETRPRTYSHGLGRRRCSSATPSDGNTARSAQHSVAAGTRRRAACSRSGHLAGGGGFLREQALHGCLSGSGQWRTARRRLDADPFHALSDGRASHHLVGLLADAAQPVVLRCPKADGASTRADICGYRPWSAAPSMPCPRGCCAIRCSFTSWSAV